MSELIDHHSVKKKKGKTKQPHPIVESPGFRKFIDGSVYVLGILGPLMTIPQIVEIWVYQDATGVSFISWFSYFAFNIFWIIYGFLHREYPIIITYTLWFVANGAVALGALLYG